jgi:hypothetical protein
VTVQDQGELAVARDGLTLARLLPRHLGVAGSRDECYPSLGAEESAMIRLAVDVTSALVVIAVATLLVGEGLAFFRRWRGGDDQPR